ncbi:hypothetical protein HG444_000710 [Candidatus Saccharibacteria bacterium]|nr:hypothetical protein [Candidatus Saccharibacteria bacterium]
MVKLLLIFVVVTDEKRKKKIMSEQLGRSATGEPTMSGWDRLNRGRRILEEAEYNKYQRRIAEKERQQKTNELQQVVDGVQREADAQLLELALRGGDEAAAREIYGENSPQEQLENRMKLATKGFAALSELRANQEEGRELTDQKIQDELRSEAQLNKKGAQQLMSLEAVYGDIQALAGEDLTNTAAKLLQQQAKSLSGNRGYGRPAGQGKGSKEILHNTQHTGEDELPEVPELTSEDVDTKATENLSEVDTEDSRISLDRGQLRMLSDIRSVVAVAEAERQKGKTFGELLRDAAHKLSRRTETDSDQDSDAADRQRLEQVLDEWHQSRNQRGEDGQRSRQTPAEFIAKYAKTSREKELLTEIYQERQADLVSKVAEAFNDPKFGDKTYINEDGVEKVVSPRELLLRDISKQDERLSAEVHDAMTQGSFGRVMEWYAERSRMQKVLIGMGMAATGGTVAVAAGGIAGAFGTGAGVALGVRAAYRSSKAYVSRRAEVYKRNDATGLDGYAELMKTAPKNAVEQIIALQQNRRNARYEFADRNKRMATVMGGLALVSSGAGIGIGALERVGVFSGMKQAMELPNTPQPVVETVNQVTTSEMSPHVSPDALQVAPGEGWYQTFQEFGATPEQQEALISDRAFMQSLVDRGVAYEDPQLGGYGITQAGNLPPDVAEQIQERLGLGPAHTDVAPQPEATPNITPEAATPEHSMNPATESGSASPESAPRTSVGESIGSGLSHTYEVLRTNPGAVVAIGGVAAAAGFATANAMAERVAITSDLEYALKTGETQEYLRLIGVNAEKYTALTGDDQYRQELTTNLRSHGISLKSVVHGERNVSVPVGRDGRALEPHQRRDLARIVEEKYNKYNNRQA